MLHSVIEQHKVHNRVHFIVVLQCLDQQFIQRFPALNCQVFRLSNSTRKMAEHVWLGVQSFFVKVLRGTRKITVATTDNISNR